MTHRSNSCKLIRVGRGEQSSGMRRRWDGALPWDCSAAAAVAAAAAGGDLPHLTVTIHQLIGPHANVGPHYARTERLLFKNFLSATAALAARSDWT